MFFSLRYLVEKILAGLVAEQPSTRPVNYRLPDTPAVAATPGGQDRSARLRRARRSLDSAPDSTPEASLLRVKRVGDDEGGDFVPPMVPVPRVSLQRMKRIDTDLPPPTRRRRSVTYDPELLAQRILEYLRK